MQLFDRFNLGHGFSKYFRIDAALDDALKDEVYRVRHTVYCEDLHFEPERPDQREIDAYDAHSVHCLLRTVSEPYHPVGCARIVLANPADPEAPLPFEQTCAAALDRSIIDPAALPRDRIAEISRLAVHRQFRRRKGEERSRVPVRDEDFSTGDQPRFPFIPTSLLLGSVALAERSGIENVFVLTEPRLAAHFAKLGVEVRQIGSPIEHRGQRIPSVMQIEEIIRNMRSILHPLWHLVRERIGSEFDEMERRKQASAQEPAA
ncbi:PEP-CTERM/exosortase system-associated acyltransferase [Thauera sinica]|uniref:PEP-CTERM/exosortase system-associated acyltransferase n=1 Tax=Thauera sinica TaxID=2665146 RepID=A0ABW1AL31_9RHOO|nr:PEP-CTERM/exosortase system-associated acyltransferase [Thauera sp. K11]ATE59115.1 GNAT family N-acetyltransferase [Thauera sp. K11]